MNLKNILLLEPFNSPLEVLTKDLGELKNNKKKALLVYAAGLVYRKYRIRLTSLHSIPLGLAQLSSIVKEEGISTDHIPFILDASKRYVNDNEIEKKISSYDYDTVWMTVGSPEAAYEIFRYAKIVKKINNKTPIMIGGILPSMYPKFFLKNQDIDFLIRGPAEVAAKQYVKNSSNSYFKNIQGFCYRTKSGQINISPKFALEPDLNKIPPYDFEGLNIGDYMKDNHFCNLQVSRGCPFNCPFCTHANFWGLTVKYRPIRNVRKEMRVLQDHGCKVGYLIDSTFTLNKEHLRKFVKAYEEEGITIKFMFETRADMFTEEIASLIARTQLKIVWFGAESGSPTVLRRLRGKDHGDGHKHVKNLMKAVKIAKKYDMLCGSSWVIGLPGENNNTVQETKKAIFDLTEAGMDISDIRILQIFPGTPYWERPEKWGLDVIQKEDITIQNSPWDKYAGHNTEELTSEKIVAAAEQIKEELFEYYLAQTKMKRKRRAKI